MSNAVLESLARHLPRYDVRSVTRLGRGLDNVVYEVNSELIVRVAAEKDPARRREAVQREADLLAIVARLSPLPVPEPVFADAEAGVLGYAKVPGVPLLEHPVAEPGKLAPALGEFVGRLHEAPVSRMARLVPRDAEPLTTWLEDAEQAYREVAGELPAAARRAVERFLGGPLPAEPAVERFCHNDLGAEHILVDPAVPAVTGIIDWSDAAIADPVHDLALIYRDLGPDVFELVLAHYSGDVGAAERERAAFYAACALVEDLAYGLRSGARRYAEAALANLDRLFA